MIIFSHCVFFDLSVNVFSVVPGTTIDQLVLEIRVSKKLTV
jgi:hypothetical protein